MLLVSWLLTGKEAQNSISGGNYALITALLLREHELDCSAQPQFSFYCTNQLILHQEDERFQAPRLSDISTYAFSETLNHDYGTASNISPLIFRFSNISPALLVSWSHQANRNNLMESWGDRGFED